MKSIEQKPSYDLSSLPMVRLVSVPGQQIESWDDHFRDLGYPSKFYKVQDASFIDAFGSGPKGLRRPQLRFHRADLRRVGLD